MAYSVLDRLLYITLLFINISLFVNVHAESDVKSSDIHSQGIKTQNLKLDISAEVETEAFPEDAPLQEESAPKKPFFSFLDKPQEYISSGVEIFAKGLDEFFSDDKVFYDTSGTYLRLRADAIWAEAGEIGYKGDLKLKLRLPHTKKKLKFILESGADERQDDISAQAENTPISAIEENNYFAGIQTTIGKEDGWQLKPSIGIRLSSVIDPYIKLRFKRKYEFTNWSIHWHETPYWFDSSGTGLDSYFELNRKISEQVLFRASTFARWTSEIDYFDMSQTFSIFHTLSPRRAMSYYAGVYGVSEPAVYATYYLLGLNYRQNIHKGYLFFELLPQVKYQKINDFQAEHSLTFRLEMLFKK